MERINNIWGPEKTISLTKKALGDGYQVIGNEDTNDRKPKSPYQWPANYTQGPYSYLFSGLVNLGLWIRPHSRHLLAKSHCLTWSIKVLGERKSQPQHNRFCSEDFPGCRDFLLKRVRETGSSLATERNGLGSFPYMTHTCT